MIDNVANMSGAQFPQLTHHVSSDMNFAQLLQHKASGKSMSTGNGLSNSLLNTLLLSGQSTDLNAYNPDWHGYQGNAEVQAIEALHERFKASFRTEFTGDLTEAVRYRLFAELTPIHGVSFTGAADADVTQNLMQALLPASLGLRPVAIPGSFSSQISQQDKAILFNSQADVSPAVLLDNIASEQFADNHLDESRINAFDFNTVIKNWSVPPGENAPDFTLQLTQLPFNAASQATTYGASVKLTGNATMPDALQGSLISVLYPLSGTPNPFLSHAPEFSLQFFPEKAQLHASQVVGKPTTNTLSHTFHSYSGLNNLVMPEMQLQAVPNALSLKTSPDSADTGKLTKYITPVFSHEIPKWFFMIIPSNVSQTLWYRNYKLDEKSAEQLLERLVNSELVNTQNINRIVINGKSAWLRDTQGEAND